MLRIWGGMGRVGGCFIRVISIISGSIKMDFEALGAIPLFIFCLLILLILLRDGRVGLTTDLRGFLRIFLTSDLIF